MKKNTVHIVWGLVVIVALVGGYFWGKSSSISGIAAGRTGTFSSSTRGAYGGRGGATGGFATGQVSAIDSSSITLQLANGNSEVVFYSSSTEVTEPTTVSISKITPGTNVMIGGTSNSDGSLTATSIQVRPATAPTAQ